MRYQVREKLFSIGEDFWVTDSQGNQVFLVDGKALRLRETFELKDRSGAVVATVRKKLLAIRDSMDMSGGTVIAQISRSWFRIRDTYGVDVAPGQDDALILAVAVCLDRIHHDEQQRR
jgi:uncharacterized protein YxjI